MVTLLALEANRMTHLAATTLLKFAVSQLFTKGHGPLQYKRLALHFMPQGPIQNHLCRALRALRALRSHLLPPPTSFHLSPSLAVFHCKMLPTFIILHCVNSAI
eukprot:GFKZ01009670.1.p4 GENE.GFKZ01009670.1~~GFKZ01009670.1.p4  ORF type:complete len:104 (-),score=3.60 GFKZ01009670.1:883-1194(-)